MRKQKGSTITQNIRKPPQVDIPYPNHQDPQHIEDLKPKIEPAYIVESFTMMESIEN